jgi:hypothetical protein
MIDVHLRDEQESLLFYVQAEIADSLLPIRVDISAAEISS